MKSLRESKSKSIYDDFIHGTISELENISLVFSSFNPFVRVGLSVCFLLSILF